MTIWITDVTGRESKSRVVEVSSDSVNTDDGGGLRRFRAADVTRVRVRQNDPVWNGALIGGAAAVGAGLFLCRAMEPWEVCNDVAPLLRLAAVGAGVGIGVDALIRGRKTIYPIAPGSARMGIVPVLGRGTGGVRVSVTF